MAIKKAVFILWICFVYSLFTLAAGESAAQENALAHRPLEHLDRKAVVFEMHNIGCDMCNRAMELFYADMTP